jgi:hypothetical protein
MHKSQSAYRDVSACEVLYPKHWWLSYLQSHRVAQPKKSNHAQISKRVSRCLRMRSAIFQSIGYLQSHRVAQPKKSNHAESQSAYRDVSACEVLYFKYWLPPVTSSSATKKSNHAQISKRVSRCLRMRSDISKVLVTSSHIE